MGLVMTTCCALLALLAGTARAQLDPSKPIRVITSVAGGGTDFAGRLIGQVLSAHLGQQIIIDNRGVVAVAGETVARAAPDGYTLLFYASPLWLAPFLSENLRYDPVKDFAPIIYAVNQPNLVVVHPQLPVKSVKELVALAKARPGELNYASGQDGAPTHIAAELLNAMAGIRTMRIGYRGSGPAFTDLISGQVQLMFPPVGGAVPHVQSGRLKALAVTSAEPSALFPGLPTVAATLAGYEATTPYGMFAPAGTATTIVNFLNQEIARVLARSDVKERLLRSGVEPVGGTPAHLGASVKAEMEKWGKLIHSLSIKRN